VTWTHPAVRLPAAGRPVIEMACGITVYPARADGDRWRAVWYEDGQRRQCESVSEHKLAAKLETVSVRLTADAPNMERSGAELVTHYLDPARHPAISQWSRKHADTQLRLCQRFALPVIARLACQDIKVRHMQQIVNAAPTAGEGGRAVRMISALVTAGIEGGYLASARLARVHWQAAGRTMPVTTTAVAGESPLWVDPAEIPADPDISALGAALAAGPGGHLDELMANTAAYAGLRWGELTALTAGQAEPSGRILAVDRKVIEVAAPVRGAAQEPQKACHHLSPSDSGRLPPGRPARRTHRAGPRRAGRWPQPAGTPLPCPSRRALAVIQLQPTPTPAGLPRRRLARR
jgi:hypothetical protein